MLKYTYLVQLGLVGTLALPALDLQSGSLEQALAETEQALAELLVRGGAPDGVGAVASALRASEPPLGAPRQRDELLERLQQDVGRLQQSLDELEVNGRAPLLDPEHASFGAQAAPAPGPAAPRTGLDDELRARLAAMAPSAPPAAAGARQRQALEPRGYSADPVRQGRALHRAGRHAEGLALLERAPASPAAFYWRARCLEGLGRVDEALRAYGEAAHLDPEGELGRRAALDREFVAWHQSFEQRLAAGRTP
jgi:tetratricopeptide (TPR) repeat protein